MRYKYYIHSTIFFAILFAILPMKVAGQSKDSTAHNIEMFLSFKELNQEKALMYAKRVDNAFNGETNDYKYGEVYDFLSNNSENNTHKYTEALRFKSIAKDIYSNSDNNNKYTGALADLGRLYFKIGDYHNAFALSHEALEVAQEREDTLNIRESYLTLEVIDFFYNKDTASAMLYNRFVAEKYSNREEARQTMRALNNRFHYGTTISQVAEIVKRCEEISKVYECNDILINVYLNAAMEYIPIEKLDSCSYYLALAKPLISNFKEEGYYYSARGFYHINNNNFKQAIIDSKRSIELLDNGEFGKKNVHTYFLLQELYKLQGNHELAYDALMSFAEIYTAENNSESVLELSRLVNYLEIENKEEQLERLRAKNTLILIIIAIVIIFIIFGLYIYNSYRRLQDEKAKQEINNKNEIIKIQKLQQYQEQQNRTQLINELNAAVNDTNNQQMRSSIRMIINRLNKGGDVSGDWVEVEKIFTSGNDTFFENLLKEYPNLTKNERKLCTFIHMNLSTKEISKITHQSVGSINIARSRLRQKFGISGDEQSLIAFLDKFAAPNN